MRTLELSLFINRPPGVVFDFMAVPHNDLLWQENLISSEWVTPEPAGVGSIKRVVSRFMGREMEATAEYTVWDRPHLYGFKSAAGPFTVSGRTSFAAQDEGTLVTIAGQVEASGVLKLAEGLAARQAEKQDQRNFKALKALLEAD